MRSRRARQGPRIERAIFPQADPAAASAAIQSLRTEAGPILPLVAPMTWRTQAETSFTRREVVSTVTAGPQGTEVMLRFELNLKPMLFITGLLCFLSFCGFFVFIPLCIAKGFQFNQENDRFSATFWDDVKRRLGAPL
jgi:hypothetical protein